MRRVRYHAHGGPDVLSIEEADVPSPAPGQVLIRTEAIGVNYVDVQLRRATDPGSLYYREPPATLTGDVVGTVCALGPGADPALAGARVAVLSRTPTPTTPWPGPTGSSRRHRSSARRRLGRAGGPPRWPVAWRTGG